VASGKSHTTLARALLDAGDDALAVIRRHQPEGPAAAHKVLSHDEVAVWFLPERLKSEPCPVAVLDNKVKAADCAWRASNGRKSSCPGPFRDGHRTVIMFAWRESLNAAAAQGQNGIEYS
jgi:hypothetical protein